MPYNYQPSSGQGSRLPVSPERLDEQNFVRTTPRLRVDLGPMAQFTDALIDALVVELQNNAEKNAARIFAFNAYGNRGFENQDFVELLGTYAQHCDLVAAQKNADIMQVIRGEAPFFVNAAVGMLVDQFPDVMNFLPREADIPLREALRDWSALTRDLRQVAQQQGYGRGAGQQSYQGGGYQRGGGQGASMGFNRMDQGNDRGYGRNFQPAADPRPSWEQDRGNAASSVAPTGNRGFNGGVTMATGRSSYEPSQPNTRTTVTPTRSAAAEAVNTRGPATAQFQEKARLVNPNQETLPEAAVKATASYTPSSSTQTTGRFDRLALEDGTELIPAIKSTYTVTVNPMRMPRAFDREQFMLFHHVNPHGESVLDRLRETLQVRTPDMNYLDHELDEALKRIYRRDGVLDRPSSPLNLDTIARIVPNEGGKTGSVVSEERLKELDALGAPRTLTGTLVADSLNAAIAQAQLEVLRTSGNVRVMEFLLKICKEHLFEPKSLSRVLALKRSKTYEELLDTMLAQGIDDPKSPLISLCNDRLTVAFNRFLSKSMYFSWTIDSFLDDYQDAKEKIFNENNEIIQQCFTKSVHYVIDQALCVLDEGELNVWYARHFTEGELADLDEPVVFADPQTVTVVPWTMYELEKRFRLEGLVSKETAGALYDALQAIYLRTTDPALVGVALTAQKLRDHLLVTDDKKILYTRAAYLSPQLEDFTVTLEPPYAEPPHESRV